MALFRLISFFIAFFGALYNLGKMGQYHRDGYHEESTYRGLWAIIFTMIAIAYCIGG